MFLTTTTTKEKAVVADVSQPTFFGGILQKMCFGEAAGSGGHHAWMITEGQPLTAKLVL